MNSENKKRIDWIDTLKLIGIFYIYLGHLGKDAGKLYPFVFSFHVPLFFLISGLFFRAPSNYKDALHKVKGAFFKIIIPYFVFSLIGIVIYAIKWDYSTDSIISSILDVLLGMRNKVPLASLWFLPCLFVVIIYYCIASMITKKPLAIFLVSLLIYCLTPLWFNKLSVPVFNVDYALNYLAFFSLGVLLSNKVKFEWPLCYEGKYKAAIMTIIILSFIYFSYSYQNGAFTVLNDIKQAQLKYLSVFIITCIMFIPSIAFAYWIDISALKKLGRNTLALCGTEQIIKVLILSTLSLFGFSPHFKDPLSAVIFTVLCLFVSYFTVIKIYESIMLKK